MNRGYQDHWGLNERPFPGGANAKFFHVGPAHEEAMARLHFLVDNGRRAGLLTGPAGSGKTAVLAALAREWDNSEFASAIVHPAGLNADVFLKSVAFELGADPPTGSDAFLLWRSINDVLIANRFQRIHTVLLVDDVDQAGGEVQTALARLTRLDPAVDSRLTVVLAADSSRQGRLDARLLELCDLRIELEPWEPDDTAEFLESSLAKAGRATPAFDESAVNRLHELAGGLPRRVEQLAELSLLAGAVQMLQQIDRGTVQSVFEELAGGNALPLSPLG